MTMSEILMLLLAMIAGLTLGAIFYGGLWWTVRVAVASTQSALWFSCSWVLRMSIVLGGFYIIGHNHWQALLLCLLGFIVSRFIVNWMTRSLHEETQQQSPRETEASHAPYS